MTIFRKPPRPFSVAPHEHGSGSLPKGTSTRSRGNDGSPRRGADGKFTDTKPTMRFGGGAGVRTIKRGGIRRHEPIG
jgi:hypothetical protein